MEMHNFKRKADGHVEDEAPPEYSQTPIDYSPNTHIDVEASNTQIQPRGRGKEGKQVNGCCCCCLIACLVLLIIGTGVLIWFLTTLRHRTNH